MFNRYVPKPYHHAWANAHDHDAMNLKADAILETFHEWYMFFLSKLKQNKLYLKNQHFSTLLFFSGSYL